MGRPPTAAEPRPWLELSVEVGVEAVEAVSEILGRVSAGTVVRPTRLARDDRHELHAQPVVGAPFVVSAHVATGPTSAAAVDATRRALWHLQAFDLGPVGALQVREVDDADWGERWREHYAPLRIGAVRIQPSWLDDEDEGGAAMATVVLDPGMAFGTGLHPTTRGCLELLQRVDPPPRTVLDVGSGSGILGLAALQLGAGRLVAVDTDRDAVTATLQNAERNGLAERVEVRHGSLAPSPQDRYELVLANLVAALHVDLAPSLAAHLAPTGALVAGGIIAPRAGEVIGAMDGARLVVVDRRDEGEWVTLLLRHAGPG